MFITEGKSRCQYYRILKVCEKEDNFCHESEQLLLFSCTQLFHPWGIFGNSIKLLQIKGTSVFTGVRWGALQLALSKTSWVFPSKLSSWLWSVSHLSPGQQLSTWCILYLQASWHSRDLGCWRIGGLFWSGRRHITAGLESTQILGRIELWSAPLNYSVSFRASSIIDR